MVNTAFLLGIIFFITACSHHEKIGNDHLIAGSCEKEFNKSKLSQGQVLWQNVSETGSTGSSYLITGLAYSTDFIVSFSSGVIGGIGFCSPLIALDVMAARSSGSSPHTISGECIGEVGTYVGKKLNPKLGPAAEDYTKKWKCPNLDQITEGLLNVADCYAAKGEKQLAKIQLDELNGSVIFNKCLSESMKNKIQTKMVHLNQN